MEVRNSVTDPMQSPPPQGSSTNTVPSIRSRQTRYRPYSQLYQSSEDAKRHRHVDTRFNREPYIPQSQDSTIISIEAERSHHVQRIYDAMTSGNSARDNMGSIAMKRWVHAAHYPANLVEAYAHKVFDCLLAQAKDGFRGWHHNDYVVDDRKGEDEDRDVNCKERLDNVIRALEEEKTICEDVMNSACQIRMFVNAPKAYANRKHQNRVGNSKRGRTKDPFDTNSRASKIQRTNGRQCRSRAAAASDPAVSGQETSRPLPQLQESSLPTYEVASSSHHFTPHSIQDFGSPLQHPSATTPHLSLSGPQADPKSPPPSAASALSRTPQTNIQMARMTSMPPPHHSPFLSPPTFSHATYSTPATPLDANTTSSILSWPSTGAPSFPPLHSTETTHPNSPIDNMAFPHDWSWPDPKLSHSTDAFSSMNPFDPYPSGHDTFTGLAQTINAENGGILNFQALWESQPGVQAFPLPGSSGDGGSR
jgi:hypothetical protein